MGYQEDELLALAATLRHALSELAQVSSAGAAGRDSLVRIERLTLRWIDSVETLLRARSSGPQAEALREALEELRVASIRIRGADTMSGRMSETGLASQHIS